MRDTTMIQVGRVCEIVRYPVKWMAGTVMGSAFLGWHGLAGDRRFAFRRVGVDSGMPWQRPSASALGCALPARRGRFVGGANSPAPAARTRAEKTAILVTFMKILLSRRLGVAKERAVTAPGMRPASPSYHQPWGLGDHQPAALGDDSEAFGAGFGGELGRELSRLAGAAARQRQLGLEEAALQLVGVGIKERQKNINLQFWKFDRRQFERCPVQWNGRIAARQQIQQPVHGE